MSGGSPRGVGRVRLPPFAIAVASLHSPTAVHSLDHLFDANRAWAREITAQEPDFFERLARQQSPEFLWIGCSDSRVPANQIVGLLPGELFVHRNVSNVVVHTDLNCLSVLQFAVDVLRVKHVMVVGHYSCGGVAAALNNLKLGLIDNWLRHVQDVAAKHRDALAAIEDETDRVNRLCELNVIEQALNVCETTIVQDAWARGQPVSVHGLIYGLQDGLLRDLGMTASAPEHLEARYAAAIAASA
jgi:carbonic anhydrase